ncbi:MAG: tripartite tricarboxylate transporter substrate-binding protein, partial [Variovorax sp.]
AKAPADGYTLLMGHIGTLAVNPTLYPNLPYDPAKSFAPVAWVARVPNVLVVHPSVPAKNLQELVALAKSKPGQLAYGSGGNGSAANLATEYLKVRTGASLLHIPYRGTAPAVTELLGGQIQVLFSGAPAVLGQVRNGQLRALAVSSPKRLEALPDVPTVAETGLAGYEAGLWYGFVGPARIPADVVRRLNAEIVAVLALPDIRERLLSQGVEARSTTPEEFARLLASDVARWAVVVKRAGLRAE